MKNAVCGSLVLTMAVLASPALGADQPLKAPVYKAGPAPISDNWTGLYVGASVGGRWSDVTWKTTDFSGLAPLTTGLPNPVGLDNSTVRAGAYLGYDFQLARSWVVGVEGDIAWGDGRKSRGGIPGNCGGCSPSSLAEAAALDSIKIKEGFDGSVRGRVGFLATPSWLVYGTGGVAWQQITASSSCNGTGVNASFCSVINSDSVSKVKTGWTVGGGVETFLARNWMARIEYRYADFGHLNNSLAACAACLSANAEVSVKTNTVLVGVAYKFASH